MLFCNHAIVDEHVGAFLPIAHLICDALNQEITIDNGGKVYVDRGSGALRFTGITIPAMQLLAAIRMLGRRERRLYQTRNTPRIA